MVELKLDTAAVEKLFPEGTELRVNLQQAVVNNIAKRALERQVSHDIDNAIRRHVQQECGMYDLSGMVRTELEKNIQNNGWNKPDTVKDYAADKIRGQVTRHVENLASTEFDKLVNGIIDKATERMKESIDRKIAQALLDVDKHVSARLNQNFAGIVDAAIAAKLGMEVKK
ncbi:hypothetical protein GAP31_014 [Cronobacter phage vB_CsaM_GAP31]|uniref:Uncharacterized protein n=1 Tax=Cronobacter phage vB_CsaM_GAP31 TaxID=1141135 RepID=K4F6H0_9CAUD|nr:hypothetical protein GAP31_014 [Cronobacter phage vB_CsaM_GAP31]AFC21192.1 hypothetical protein GAP31_014 [Cronobacter phage vB_CsaM_GAP31]